MQSDVPLLHSRRIAALGTSLAALAIIVGLSAASARNDDGSRTFFLSQARSLFDWGGEAPAATARSIGQQTVDAGRRRVASRAQRLAKLRTDAKLKMAAVRGSKPVTILTDATLQRGDAVMTGKGIRVFTGASAFPHREKDFVGVNWIGGLPRGVARTLIALNNVPPA